MNYYCTLFDSNYLIKGLSMYYSLRKIQKDSMLFVIAFDDEAYDVLLNLKLSHMKVISLSEFEDERLLKIKATRNRKEYCWTCSCFSIKYVMEHFSLNKVTYLDADLYFYRDPNIIFRELDESEKSVRIMEHDFSKNNKRFIKYGKYCVQFMTFVNDEKGREVLNWWCDRCEEWCYDRLEKRRYGDQKYLDDWPERFDSVHVFNQKELCVAPWNIQNYKVTRGPMVNKSIPVFFHFHNLKWLDLGVFNLTDYPMTMDYIQYIYIPYVHVLQHVRDDLIKKVPSFCKGIDGYPPRKHHIKESIQHPMDFLRSRKLVRHIMGTYNQIKI